MNTYTSYSDDDTCVKNTTYDVDNVGDQYTNSYSSVDEDVHKFPFFLIIFIDHSQSKRNIFLSFYTNVTSTITKSPMSMEVSMTMELTIPLLISQVLLLIWITAQALRTIMKIIMIMIPLILIRTPITLIREKRPPLTWTIIMLTMINLRSKDFRIY